MLAGARRGAARPQGVDGDLQPAAPNPPTRAAMPVVEIPANALVILVGPSGCGKSTFARRRFRDTEVVSSDECRRLVSDDEAEQAATAQAFEVFHAIVRGRLSLGRLAVADATNLSPGARARLRGEAARWGAPAVVLVLDVPLATCLAQNLERARRVPPEVIELHHAQFTEARGVLAAEGYDVVHVVGPGTEVAVRPPVRKPPPPAPAPLRPAAPAPREHAESSAAPGARPGAPRGRTRSALGGRRSLPVPPELLPDAAGPGQVRHPGQEGDQREHGVAGRVGGGSARELDQLREEHQAAQGVDGADCQQGEEEQRQAPDVPGSGERVAAEDGEDGHEPGGDHVGHG